MHRGRSTCLSPFDYPRDQKQIAVVSASTELIDALASLAAKEAAQVRLCRPRTPDIIVFSANVRVVNRGFLGMELWEQFCAFMDEINDPNATWPIADEDGNAVLVHPLFDETPLIIVDRYGDRLPLPLYLRCKARFIQESATDLIVQLVRNHLRAVGDGHTVASIRAES